MKEKQKIWLGCLSVLGLLCALLALRVTGSLARYASAQARVEAKRVIVIDAGHGDFDPGAVAGDCDEKDVNLAIALALRDCFEAGGYTVVMTRTDDNTLAKSGPDTSSSLKTADTRNRSTLADSLGDAVMISIHQNAFADRSQHGTQVFYGTLNDRSEAIAEAIQMSVRDNLQPENKRKVKRGTDSIYILVHTKVPTVLVECGFMTNGDELAQLKDPEYQKKIAYCIYLGYVEFETYEDTVEWRA